MIRRATAGYGFSAHDRFGAAKVKAKAKGTKGGAA